MRKLNNHLFIINIYIHINMNISNFKTKKDEKTENVVHVNKDIHIRIKKRTAKKSITTIYNLKNIDNDPKFLKSLEKTFKKKFNTSAFIKENEEGKTYLALGGDHRQDVKNFLLKSKYCKLEDIKIHGF